MSWCGERGFRPGIVSVMHTFGSTLNFHPHIHILLTEGGLGEDENFDFLIWKECNFFPEKVSKERFKYFLTKYLREWAKNNNNYIVPDEVRRYWIAKKGCDNLYDLTRKLYDVTWYVHIGEKLENAEFVTRYIGRYAKRPCVSEANITHYDPKNKTVSFLYKDKLENNAEKMAIVPILEFIGRLIRHIPDKNFRMIRYYGIYANCVKNEFWDLLVYQISQLFSLAKIIFTPNNYLDSWRDRIIASTGCDPLVCKKCGVEMVLTQIGYRTRDGTFKIYPVIN